MKTRVLNFLFEKDKYSMRVQVTLFNRNIVLYIGNDPELVAFGFNNETEDNYFVPVIDYDNILYEKVVKDIRHIQKVFSLGPMVVVVNSEEYTSNNEVYGNYGVVGFDKLSFQEHLEMLNHTRCDRNYIGCPKFYKSKHWVLRFREKWFVSNGKVQRDRPKLKDIIFNKPDFQRQASYAHYLMIRKLFNIPVMKLNYDGNASCELVQYRTGMK